MSDLPGLSLRAHCSKLDAISFESVTNDSSITHILILVDPILLLSMELSECLTTICRLSVNVRVLVLLIALILLELWNTLRSIRGVR